MEFIDSIREALKALGIFNELKNHYNITQYIDTTVIKIDMELVQKFFAVSSLILIDYCFSRIQIYPDVKLIMPTMIRHFIVFQNYPSKSEIREAYLTKNYTHVTIEQLEESYKVVRKLLIIAWLIFFTG